MAACATSTSATGIDDTWTEPRLLGGSVNSEFWDIYPSISPDGDYFFFTRRDAWQSKDDSDIYWIRADAILAPGDE